MKIDNQKLDLMLARRCMSLRDLRNGTSPQTLTRIRRGESIKPVTVGRIAEVEELVLNAALQVRRAAESKEINLSIQPPSKPIAVCCDPKWTEEAIFNILDNAVKYTPQGGQVALTLESYETYCRINISDTGCGIPPEEIPKIFQRFYRGQSVQAVEGVGLGLPLARKVVQEQGGWIKVSSDHKGSTFSIFLRRS